MEYIDTLTNIYGETADIYEAENGNAFIIFEGSREKHEFTTVQKAVNKLYRLGFQF